MVMKLYGIGTMNVQRAILPLFEAKPFGQVPYFEDGDVTIFESRAIARYLAEKYDGRGTDLLGKTPKERAAVHQWTETEAHSFTAASDPLIRELRHAEILQRPVNEELVKRSEPRLNQVLDIYEAHLSSQETKYLAGDRYSLAEVFHTAHVNWLALHRPDFFATRPCVSAWVKDITTRPAFLKCLQMDWERAPLLQ